MRNCTTIYLVLAIVFERFLQSVICLRKCNNTVHDCMDFRNFTVNSAYVDNFKKKIVDKSDYEVPFLLKVKENYYSGNISNECKDSLNKYFNDLMSLKPWALEMLDASGKPPSTLMLGSLTDFGSYEDCLRIKVHSDDVHFRGQFCMIHLQHPFFQPPRFKTEDGRDYIEAFGHPPLWVSDFVHEHVDKRFGLYLGACTPSTCTEEDLYNIINTLAEPTASNVTITDCAVEKENESRQLTFLAKFAIVMLSSILILCVIGTSLDLHDRKETEKKPQISKSINRDVLKCFSVYTNTKALFSEITKKSAVDCTCGIRCAACFSVIISHYVVYPTPGKFIRYSNLKHAHEFLQPGLILFIVNNGIVVVEGFFCLSGFLLIYTVWPKMEKNGGHINIWENLYQRYWRLTPIHFFVIALSFLLPYLNSGAIWDSSWDHEHEKCFRNGWKNILYLHNFDDALEICWIHTWFIAVTMQFAVIFIPLVVILYKYPKMGIMVSLMIWFGSMVHDYNTSINQGFSFCSYNHLRIPQRAMDFLTAMYLKTNFHFPCYLVGMLSGWIVLKYKNHKLSKVWLYIGWFFCAWCFIISIYAVHLPMGDITIGSLYNAMRNTLYCSGVSWIVYVCATGQAGVLDEFLSWKGFVPITKISYSLYLVHPFLLAIRDASLTDRFYMDKIAHVIEVIPYIFLTFICSFIVYVTVEEPCNKLYDIHKKSFTTASKSLPSSTSENGSVKTERNKL